MNPFSHGISHFRPQNYCFFLKYARKKCKFRQKTALLFASIIFLLYLCTVKETTIYQFIKTLQKKGVWNGIAGSCSYWATRADYLTIYEYVQTNFPTHPYGYLVKTANALSNKRLGGGVLLAR